MSSVNKAILVGNLGQDPEMRYTQSGDAVCSLSVATSETWKDKNTGEKKEATEWHRVTIFGKLAEIAGEYLRKGSKVYVEGKIKTQKYTDNNGVEKYSTSIQASEMRMLSSANEGQQQQQQVQQRQQAQQPKQQPRQSQGANPNRGGGNNAFDNTPNFDDDIPF